MSTWFASTLIRFYLAVAVLFLSSVGVAHALVGVRATTFNGVAATNSLTINKPAGTVAGDFMIASITFRPCSNVSGGACTVTITPPAGWTEIRHVDQTTGAGTGGYGNRLFVYSRLAGVGEPANYTWTMGGAPTHAGAAGGIASFTGVDTANPIVVDAGQPTASSRSHTAPDIGPVATNTLLVSTHTANSSATWTPPAGMTEIADWKSLATIDDLGLCIEINHELRPLPGATGTRTATFSNPPAADTGAAHILALRPIQADPTIAMARSGPLVPGGSASYTLTVGNNGPAAIGAGNISVTDTLPAGLTYVSGSGANWSCAAAGQVITCTYSAGLASGASAPALTINVNVAAGASGILTNTAVVSSGVDGDNTTGDSTVSDSYIISTPLPAPYAWYAMDESAWGSITDSSGNGRNGTLIGSASPTGYPNASPPGPAIAGPTGTCGAGLIPVGTNGIDTGIDINGGIGNAGTIMFWYSSNTAWNDGTDRMLFDASNNLGNGGADKHFYLVKGDGGELRFGLEDSADDDELISSGANAFPANEWHHITVTWSWAAGTMRLYLDGTEVVNTGINDAIGNYASLFLGTTHTGITGTDTDFTTNSANGYLDELRVYNSALSAAQIASAMALTHSCGAVDHVEFVHDGSALTCTPKAITVLACTASASCNGTPANQYTAGSFSISPTAIAGAQWCIDSLCATPLTSPATVNNGDLVYLRDTATGVDRLGGTTVSASNATIQCFNTSDSTFNATTACDLDYAASGFLVSLPNHVSCANSTLTVQAVRASNNATVCVPMFRNSTRTETVSFAYSNPATGTLVPTVAGTSISTAGTSVSLSFDNNGIATPSFVYQDVGKLSITVTDPVLPMTGTTSTPPIIAPANFSFSAITAGPIGAGNAFSATMTALNGCATPAATPNFGKESAAEGVTLTSNLVSPVGGNNPGIGNNSILGGTFVNGVATVNNLSWGEVGFITMTADLTSGGYLGSVLTASGTSGNVGRFIPDHFDTEVTQTCAAGGFSYAGQPFAVKVTAENAGGNKTLNYNTAAGFSKDVTLSAWDSTGTLANPGPGNLTPAQPPAIIAASAFASLDPAVALVNTPAYVFTSRQTAPTTVRLRATDTDAVSSATGSEGTAIVRSGRASLSNAHGSELLDLPVPFQVEYWNGSWLKNTDDTCTSGITLALADVSGSDGLVPGETCVLDSGNPGVSGIGCAAAGVAPKHFVVPPAAADFRLWLKAPGLGNSGALNLMATVPVWLQFNWKGIGDANPSARVTFGVNAARKSPTIYMRENY